MPTQNGPRDASKLIRQGDIGNIEVGSVLKRRNPFPERVSVPLHMQRYRTSTVDAAFNFWRLPKLQAVSGCDLPVKLVPVATGNSGSH